MPIMNGYQTCKKILELIQKGEIHDVKIVAVTADVTKANKEKCARIGFDLVLTKPISLVKLVKVLKKYFDNSQKN